MADAPENIDLDAYSTADLNILLSQVMLKLRERDAQDIRNSLLTKSQHVTLQQTVEDHVSKRTES